MLRHSFLRLLTRRLSSTPTEALSTAKWSTMPFFGNTAAKKTADLSDGDADAGEAVRRIAEWDPQQICDLAKAADSAAVSQQASEHWPIVAGVQHALEWMHTTTGCPWWLSISLMTVVFRCLIFPVTLIQIRNSVRLSNAMPETEATKATFEKYLAEGMETLKAREWYTKEIAKIWQKHKCNPLTSMLPLTANAFVFVNFFIALRGLSEIKVLPAPISTTESISECIDPYYILPVINSAIFLITIELGAADGMQGTAPEMINKMRIFMRILSVVFVPITARFQSSLFCYWISSSLISLIQSSLMKNDSIRKFLRLPASVRRSNFDPVKNPVFARPVMQVNEKGEAVPFKAAPLSVTDTRSIWKQRMESIAKGQWDIKPDAAPVVYKSTLSKNQPKTSKMRLKRKK